MRLLVLLLLLIPFTAAAGPDVQGGSRLTSSTTWNFTTIEGDTEPSDAKPSLGRCIATYSGTDDLALYAVPGGDSDPGDGVLVTTFTASTTTAYEFTPAQPYILTQATGSPVGDGYLEVLCSFASLRRDGGGGGGGSSPFTDGSGVTHLTDGSEDFGLGWDGAGTDPSDFAVYVDVSAGRILMNVDTDGANGNSMFLNSTHVAAVPGEVVLYGLDDETFWLKFPTDGGAGIAGTQVGVAASSSPAPCGVTIEAATVTDSVKCKATEDLTLVSFDCSAEGGTADIVMEVEECDATGNSCASTGASVTVNDIVSNFNDTTFSDAAIDDGDWVRIVPTTVTTAPTLIHCQAEFS